MKAASLEIRFLDVEDEPVEPIFDLETTYAIQVVVTNLTETRGGEPWEALLEVGVGVSLDGIDLVPYTMQAVQFSPNQVQHIIPEIYILSAYAGMRGKVTAKVIDPFGGLLASASKRFAIGHEVSPEAACNITAGLGVKGADIPFLNPNLDNSEGQVVVGGGVSRPPLSPPPQPAPKIDFSKSKPAPGLDSSSTPEARPEFEGETVFGGRLG